LIFIYIYNLFSEINDLPVIRTTFELLIVAWRRFHREFSHVGLSVERMRAWIKRARNFSRQYNVEFRVLVMMVTDTHYDR